MAQLQPSSNSQQIVNDLIQRLSHVFSEEADSADVDFVLFKLILNRVFTNASEAKLEQIFVSFDEESKGTINWYQFLKSEQLSRVLLSLHDDCISQISLLQQSSCESSELNANTSENMVNMLAPGIGSRSIPLADSHQYNWPRTSSMPPNLSQTSSAELQQEVQEKHQEIEKLREWITKKGLPAQKSVAAYTEKEKKQLQRESELVNELKRFQDSNESLKAQNVSLQKEYNIMESQHTALKNEHMSFKVLCNEIQRKYDECLELYKRSKDQNTNLMAVNENLNKLNDQYERVNNDQNAKIAGYKDKTEDLREKCGIFEMYIAEIVAENENLHQMLKDAQNTESGADNVASRPRGLSAVRENAESGAPKLKLDANAEKLPPKHHTFQPSGVFKKSNFEDIVRRYSVGSASGARNRRGSSQSLLMRIRSQKSIMGDVTTPGSDVDYPSYQMHSTQDSLLLEDQNTSGSFKRRKRTVSILSIGGLMTPHGKRLLTLQDSIGQSGTFDSIDMDNDDDGSGYADAAYEEFGDGFDQLEEITDQLRVEIQEELEEELEKQIQNKYDLKLLKLKTTHNEQLMLLNVEIDRLKTINKKQSRQLKVVLNGGGDLSYVDDQKTNERVMGDDMDDFDNMSMEDEYSDATYSSSSSSGDGEKHHVAYNDDYEPLLSDEDSAGGRKYNKHHHKKKKHKKKTKKQKLVDQYAVQEMHSKRFCCSAIWKDYSKIHDDDAVASTASEGNYSRRKHKKDKRHKKKKKKEKERKKNKSKHKKKKKKKKKKGDEDEKQRRSKKIV